MPRPRKDLSSFKKDLAELMENDFPSGAENEIFHDMLYNIGRLREEKLDILELRLLNTAFAELRYALKVFKPYRSVPKAAVFGSARTKPGHPDYKIAEDFGKKLTKKGWMIITGGASGIMEAAMLGAGAKTSFGLNIMLPFEQLPNTVIRGNEKLINFKYFFTRKLMFLKESQATVLFPGGFGTFDEGFESFTLMQTGKARPRPLVLVDTPKSLYWKGLLDYMKKHLEATGLISPADLTMIRHFQDPDKAVAELTGFYKNYDSSRFLRDQYLVRLRKPVSDAALETMNAKFRDILAKGKFERLDDLREDVNEGPTLYRIVFQFDKSSYARLRQLIDYLNTL
jgi:uncharacterized protein (TIGR00730 family)